VSPLGKTATNERIKLTASSVNTIGLAIGLTGGVIPTIGLLLPDAPTLLPPGSRSAYLA
jgi:hypothetical protein